MFIDNCPEGLQARIWITDSNFVLTCGCPFDVFSSLRSFACANDTENISEIIVIIFIFILRFPPDSFDSKCSVL